MLNSLIGTCGLTGIMLTALILDNQYPLCSKLANQYSIYDSI